MKTTSFIQLNLVVIMSFFTTTFPPQNKSDTTAIQNILQEEVISWNNGDATTYSKMGFSAVLAKEPGCRQAQQRFGAANHGLSPHRQDVDAGGNRIATLLNHCNE